LWGCEEAPSTVCPGWSLRAGEPCLGGSRLLGQGVRRQATTALRGEAGPTGRAPRRQGPAQRGDDLGGLGPRTWSPPLPIRGREADGAVGEQRGVPAGPNTGARLPGLRGTGKGRAAQRLAGFAGVGPLRAPLRIDRALGLRLAMVRVAEPPALRAPTITRGHERSAIPIRQRGQGHRLRLGEDLLRLGQGRGDPREPRETGIGQLVPLLGVRASAVGDKISGAGGGVGSCAMGSLTTCPHPLPSLRLPRRGFLSSAIPACGATHNAHLTGLRAGRGSRLEPWGMGTTCAAGTAALLERPAPGPSSYRER